MSSSSPDRVIAVVGPTGVGKTDVGVELCLALGGEVVSADSMQIYRHMNIGTAKVAPEEMRGVPHHMLDIVDPDQPFTVRDYVDLADECIKGIISRGHMPVIVGGTGLYVKALLEDYLFPDQGANWDFRERMKMLAETEGNDKLHAMLEKVDPPTAARLHPNDTRRVIRALEVYESTGHPMSEQMARYGPSERRYDAMVVGLTAPREVLYERIDRRVDMMMADGLLDEVKSLMSSNFAGALTAMQALGYKEFIPFLKGLEDLPTAVDVLKRDTRRYAKRQLSWFRRETDIIWIDRSEWPDTKELSRHLTTLIAGR